MIITSIRVNKKWISRNVVILTAAGPITDITISYVVAILSNQLIGRIPPYDSVTNHGAVVGINASGFRYCSSIIIRVITYDINVPFAERCCGLVICHCIIYNYGSGRIDASASRNSVTTL